MSNYLPLIVRETLVKTGWNENEIAVYSALLEKGAMSLTDLSEETSIPISTLQYVIKKLQLKKMLSKTMLNGKPLYSVSDIAQLKKWMKGYTKQFLQFEDIIHKFIDQYDFNPSIYTPKVRFFEGTKGVKQSYRQMIKECKGKEIRSIFSVIENVGPDLESFIFKEYIPLRVKKKILSKNISLHCDTGFKYLKNKKEYLSETKVIQKESFPNVNSEITLYDENIHVMSYSVNGAFAMILQDEALVAILDSIFELLWTIKS